MMAVWLSAVSIGAGYCFGAIVGLVFYERHREVRRKKRAKEALGTDSVLQASSVSLESGGFGSWLIEKAIQFSVDEHNLPPSLLKAGSYGFSKKACLFERAGINRVLTGDGYACARIYFSVGGLLVGCLLGACFSSLLAAIGSIVGAIWGWGRLSRAIKEEARCRALSAEQQFSQMIEVIVLGLNSGMSFDKALLLYCDSFGGSLSEVAGSAQRQWAHSLIDRSEGLRQIARSYDSLLFDRFAENVIRSIRFGTSMAENLSLLAVEARSIRKGKLEERVAKAPVKMMLPVATLILPAMLMLVMGPIMLDLMEGI